MPVVGLRIGLPNAWLEADCDPAIARAIFDAATAFRSMDAAIVDVPPPDIETLTAHCMVIMQAEAAALHAPWVRKEPGRYESQTRARLESGFAIPATAYIDALRIRGRSLERFCAAVLADADLLLLPAMSRLTPTLAETGRGSGPAGARAINEVTRLLRWVNFLGIPALALPCGFDQRGLPIGLQLVGRPFAEPVLLRAGAAFQRETDWHRRSPCPD